MDTKFLSLEILLAIFINLPTYSESYHNQGWSLLLLKKIQLSSTFEIMSHDLLNSFIESLLLFIILAFGKRFLTYCSNFLFTPESAPSISYLTST